MSASPFLQTQQFHTPGLARQVLLEQRAHYMRFHPTASEALLWSRLRARKLGLAFKRQFIIGNFIVDFYAPKARLVVEVDGERYHAARAHLDAARDRKLKRAGYRVVRVPASLVMRDVDAAVRRVFALVHPS